MPVAGAVIGAVASVVPAVGMGIDAAVKGKQEEGKEEKPNEIGEAPAQTAPETPVLGNFNGVDGGSTLNMPLGQGGNTPISDQVATQVGINNPVGSQLPAGPDANIIQPWDSRGSMASPFGGLGGGFPAIGGGFPTIGW